MAIDSWISPSWAAYAIIFGLGPSWLSRGARPERNFRHPILRQKSGSPEPGSHASNWIVDPAQTPFV